MENEYWLERWNDGRTGFHLDQFNPLLIKHWPSTGASSGELVFVPLCGKSLDMIWFQQQGHFVVGSELSEKAVTDFFYEQRLKSSQQPANSHQYWQSKKIGIIQGDFFTMEAGSVPAKYIYDRAALIALPEDKQEDYINQLLTVAPDVEQILLCTVEYDESIMPGPPFSVTPDRVDHLFNDRFSIDLLETRDTKPSPSHQEKGLTVITDHVFKLDRR